MSADGYLIDWLTLRLPISPSRNVGVYEVARRYIGRLIAVNAAGERVWERATLDVEALRSDSPGLFWQVTGDGINTLLVIAASPASLEHGVNVWGSLDIRHCARVLIQHAARALGVVLPDVQDWQCRRVDITANYALPDSVSVKHALAQLLVTQGARRRPSSHARGGDTVYWNPGSDLVKGKAYHKGPQITALRRRLAIDIDEEREGLLYRVLRLEHTRGARWFRRLEQGGGRWQDLCPEALKKLHADYFGPLIGDGIEVINMQRDEILKAIVDATGCTAQQAHSAYCTYLNIRQHGHDIVRDTMSRATYYRHMRMLRDAGYSDNHLRNIVTIPYPRVRIVYARPVSCWEEIRRAA